MGSEFGKISDLGKGGKVCDFGKVSDFRKVSDLEKGSDLEKVGYLSLSATVQSDNFDLKHFDEVNQFIEDSYVYFYPPEDPDDYRTDMDDDHDLVANINSDTLIRIVKFLKRGKAPGPDNIHNEVLRLDTTTSLFHHLVRLFTSSIQIGYIPTAWKLATLRMLLKPDNSPLLQLAVGLSAL